MQYKDAERRLLGSHFMQKCRVQESLPELIGEFDRSMNKVSRRSMELASMKQLSRAVLDQEQSAVGELEEHLKYVGVSMRTHLHSIFVEVNRWPALIQKLLVHKGTKDEMEDQQADSSAQNDSLPAPFVPAGELYGSTFCTYSHVSKSLGTCDNLRNPYCACCCTLLYIDY